GPHRGRHPCQTHARVVLEFPRRPRNGASRRGPDGGRIRLGRRNALKAVVGLPQRCLELPATPEFLFSDLTRSAEPWAVFPRLRGLGECRLATFYLSIQKVSCVVAPGSSLSPSVKARCVLRLNAYEHPGQDVTFTLTVPLSPRGFGPVGPLGSTG